jgi:hypothetical protein
VHLVPKRRKKLIDFLVLLHRCRQGAVGRGKSMDAREEGVGKRMLEKKDRLACLPPGCGLRWWLYAWPAPTPEQRP